MRLRGRKRTAAVLVASLVGVMLGLTAVAVASKEYVAPRAYHAKTYPARDEHPNEKVTIAADPYDLPDKASIFVLHYLEKGYLPVYLLISNDRDQPISLADMRVQMVTVDRVKLSPANEEDLYRRFAKVKRRGDEVSRNPFPIPLPRKAKAGVGKEGEAEIESAPFRAKAVEPHGTQAGFLFFDVAGLDHPLAGAHLYITRVRDANGGELMFFDIPMEKYLSYRPGK
jgi:hypothetical protein